MKWVNGNRHSFRFIAAYIQAFLFVNLIITFNYYYYYFLQKHNRNKGTLFIFYIIIMYYKNCIYYKCNLYKCQHVQKKMLNI